LSRRNRAEGIKIPKAVSGSIEEVVEVASNAAYSIRSASEESDRVCPCSRAAADEGLFFDFIWARVVAVPWNAARRSRYIEGVHRIRHVDYSSRRQRGAQLSS